MQLWGRRRKRNRNWFSFVSEIRPIKRYRQEFSSVPFVGVADIQRLHSKILKRFIIKS